MFYTKGSNGINAYMRKEFEVCPGWYITRNVYEGFPCAMRAWNWDDEKMSQLAKSVAKVFEPVIYDEQGKEIVVSMDEVVSPELEVSYETLCDEFYTAIENCACDMGMVYYEDLSGEEYEKDELAFMNFAKKLNEEF